MFSLAMPLQAARQRSIDATLVRHSTMLEVLAKEEEQALQTELAMLEQSTVSVDVSALFAGVVCTFLPPLSVDLFVYSSMHGHMLLLCWRTALIVS